MNRCRKIIRNASFIFIFATIITVANSMQVLAASTFKYQVANGVIDSSFNPGDTTIIETLDNNAGTVDYLYVYVQEDVDAGKYRFTGGGCMPSDPNCIESVYVAKSNPSRGEYQRRNAEGNWETLETISISNTDTFDETIEETAKSSPTTDNPTSQASQTDERNCEENGLGYFVCPLIEGILRGIEGIQNGFIKDYLRVDALDTDGPTYKVWSSMRNLTNSLFVLIFFVIIIANVASIGIDAYTVKKALPRLFIAAIGVQLSFFATGILIDVTNVVGEGIGQLLVGSITEVPTLELTNFVSGSLVAGGILGLIAVAANPWLLLMFLGPLMLIALAVAFTLVLRQVLITFLIIVSPLAFVAWVLPNTDKMFKQWSDLLMKTLAMYPLIMILFASGKIFGAAIVAADGGGAFSTQFRSLSSVLAQVIPLVLIPATFKMAGAGIQSAFNAVNGVRERAAGGKDGKGGLKGALAEKAGETRAKTGVGLNTNVGGRNRFAQALNRPGFNKFGVPSAAGAVAAFQTEKAKEAKSFEEIGVQGNSHVLGALALGGHKKALAYHNSILADPSASADDKINAQKSIDGINANEKAIKHFSGSRMPMAQAAALEQLSTMGLATQEHFEATKEALAANPQIMDTTLSNAGLGAAKKSPAAEKWLRGYHSQPTFDSRYAEHKKVVKTIGSPKMLEYKKIDATSEAAIHDLYRSDASYKTSVDQIIASPDFSRMSLDVQKALKRVVSYDLSEVSTQASGTTTPVDISQLNAKAKDF